MSDGDSDSEEEVDSALETMNMRDPSDQTGKSKNTYKLDGRFPEGRNDRNVKWQGLIAINSLLESFITV